MKTAIGSPEPFHGTASLTMPQLGTGSPKLSDHDVAEIAYLEQMFTATAVGGDDE